LFGGAVSSRYRSVVFYANESQRRAALAEIAVLARSKTYSEQIVTEVTPLRAFYPAEAYHQHFADRNSSYPYILAIDAPKVMVCALNFPSCSKRRIKGPHFRGPLRHVTAVRFDPCISRGCTRTKRSADLYRPVRRNNPNM